MATTNNLGCGPLTVKYLVFIFNAIFFVSGLLLMIVGGIAQVFFSNFTQFFSGSYVSPAIGVVILGAIIVVISFFGCCGAKKENVFMLRLFATFMILILVLEFAAAITVAVLRPNIEVLVRKNMNDTMNQYGDPKALVTKTWDDLQTKYQCCGTDNYTDWEGTPYSTNTSGVPDSCCKTMTTGCGHDVFPLSPIGPPLNIYTTPCFQALVNSARHNTGAIIGGIIGLALLQMIGIWMSCCLVKAVKERYEIL